MANTQELPKVSIVTVVHNGVATLEQCICSVRAQTYANIEHIVIDGGSLDGTVDLIKKFSDSIAFWVSENDGGIYEAMNKGMNRATGEFIGILNADDWLESHAIEAVVQSLQNGGDFSYADAFVADASGSVIGKKRAEESVEKALPYRMPFAHQTFYARRRVIQVIGGYDVSYRLSADLEYICRVVERGFKGVKVVEPFSNFRLGGASGGVKTFLETRRIARRHGMGRITSWLRFCESLTKMGVVSLLPRSVSDAIRSKLGSSYEPSGPKGMGE
ncbi:glycosyltransferase family 2 protein [Aquabacterium sp. CECT 9606]|uniref:glycosyltransferase family 2 protein n=1 Tax=Aquabacterium sp. CECT 9606 TaxID=2845822 RepID=UPI001E298DF1|nr:glycosyltransferase family 2 protein [Aquabacterium sp. CECT 9606]CAH0354103.1 hypothetical protein AQB9606_03490 [Aquabacterium sp. CECT 9606]